MKTFILNSISNITSISKNMDLISCIKNSEWIVYNGQDNEVEKFIFLDDNKLLVSLNGKSSYSEWKYIPVSSSLIIDNKKDQYLFKILWCNKELIVLNIDSTNKYCFLINSNFNALKNTSFEILQWYLIKECGIDILSESQKKQYAKEQEIIKAKKEEEDKQKNKRYLHIYFVFCFVLSLLCTYSVVKSCIKNKEEYKRLNPTIYETMLENRKAIDLGLSVKWASCNIGANSPEESGNYYGWGEPTGKDIFKNKGETVKSLLLRFPSRDFETPPTTIIGTSNDIARQNWGGNWRMPTRDEAEELIAKCKIEFTIINNIDCAKVIGPNGNYIYLPSVGFVDGDGGNWLAKYDEIAIYLWTGDIYKIWEGYEIKLSSMATMINIYETNKPDYSGDTIYIKTEGIDRYKDLPVRAVME